MEKILNRTNEGWMKIIQKSVCVIFCLVFSSCGSLLETATDIAADKLKDKDPKTAYAVRQIHENIERENSLNNRTSYSAKGERCLSCAGTGKCKECLGKGYYNKASQKILCPKCDERHNGVCPSCHGTGYR